MKIVVCVKQVPEVSNVQVDPVTGTLNREGVKAILNPFCEYAIDLAVRLAQSLETSEIIAITMGPPQARDALLRSMELGADRSVLVTDRKFAGADTWATSRTLAAAIRHAVPDFDLIITGKQAIDGDTAQVGPEIAEILGLPQITYGIEISQGNSKKTIRVKREVERGYEIIETTLPALITVSKGEVVRRAPSFKDVIEARKKSIQVITANDLDIPEEELGLKGSFTQVVKIFQPSEKKGCLMIQNEEAFEAAQQILVFLQDHKYLP
mgnify:CR=1 FL=1